MCVKFVLTLQKHVRVVPDASRNFDFSCYLIRSPTKSHLNNFATDCFVYSINVRWINCDFFFTIPKATMVDIGDSLVAKRHTYGEDCMNCRLVSGFGIIGMGIYVFTAAKRQKVNLNRNFIYAFSFGNFWAMKWKIFYFLIKTHYCNWFIYKTYRNHGNWSCKIIRSATVSTYDYSINVAVLNRTMSLHHLCAHICRPKNNDTLKNVTNND